MLERYALLFADAMGLLSSLGPMWRPQPLSASLSGTDEEREAFRESRLQLTLDALRQVRAACNASGLAQVFAEIDRLESTLTSPFPMLDDTSQSLRHLHSRIRDELENEYFAHVARTDVALYGKADLFGAAVAAKLGLAEDITAAGNCLALGQSTACVFHLMRLMERGLHILGRKLHVKFDPAKQSWFEICNRASTAVTNRPAKNARQRAKNAALGAAVAHLQTVRLAWRNEVMHPKQTYSQEEAREVFNATRTFLADLASLV